ncbi:MAG: signal peptidase I [Chloroflexi bacterium]|nr:signal peptidase I [Chloroflexota bacterium]
MNDNQMEKSLKYNSWQRLIVAFLLIAFLQTACLPKSTRVMLNGQSMEPNFADGQIFNVVQVPLSELQRGDLVLVEIDGNQLLKRLIGLPGETISIHDGKVFVNGEPLVEAYETIPPPYTMEEIKLDNDSYFVLGDNRPASYDSHMWGPLKGSGIKGKATPW